MQNYQLWLLGGKKYHLLLNWALKIYNQCRSKIMNILWCNTVLGWKYLCSKYEKKNSLFNNHKDISFGSRNEQVTFRVQTYLWESIYKTCFKKILLPILSECLVIHKCESIINVEVWFWRKIRTLKNLNFARGQPVPTVIIFKIPWEKIYRCLFFHSCSLWDEKFYLRFSSHADCTDYTELQHSCFIKTHKYIY